MLHQGKKRVIVFLIYADFRIEPNEDGDVKFKASIFSMNKEMKIELNLLLKEILTTPLNPQNARLYVIFNTIRSISDNKKVPYETKTLFYEIGNDRNLPFNQFKKVKVLNEGETNTMQVSYKLTKLLKNVPVKSNEEVVLVTWDHGSAFGIFRDANPNAKHAEIRKDIDEELEDYPYLKEFWDRALINPAFNKFIKTEKKKIPNPVIYAANNFYSLTSEYNNWKDLKDMIFKDTLSGFWTIPKNDKGNALLKLIFDKEKYLQQDLKDLVDPSLIEIAAKGLNIKEAAAEILTNKELADSIKGWIKNKKVAVLLMMNCWMMNLHTMYALRNNVECLVAPQGDIAIPGYNYRDILRYIYKPKTYYRSNQKLAIKMVQTCENKFALKRAENVYKQMERVPRKIDEWKIIAIDLQKKDFKNKRILDKQIVSLKKLIDVMNCSVEDEQESEMKWLFKYVRSLCFDFAVPPGGKMIDIRNWVSSIRYSDEGFSGASKLNNDTVTCIDDFLASTAKEDNNSIILKMSEGKSVYPENNDSRLLIAGIRLPPTGYTLFFPELDFNDDLNLKDNISKDQLLKRTLSNWKIFLNKSIDENITF
ncbi:MAG: clostripain-related cysteine peptidase [Ferruginibacter sp.]